jgi:hypothetical protein
LHAPSEPRPARPRNSHLMRSRMQAWFERIRLPRNSTMIWPSAPRPRAKKGCGTSLFPRAESIFILKLPKTKSFIDPAQSSGPLRLKFCKLCPERSYRQTRRIRRHGPLVPAEPGRSIIGSAGKRKTGTAVRISRALRDRGAVLPSTRILLRADRRGFWHHTGRPATRCIFPDRRLQTSR